MGICFSKDAKQLADNRANRMNPLGDFFEEANLSNLDIKAFDAMGMDGKDIRALYRVFETVDADSSGAIDTKEFFDYFKFAEPTVLMLRFLSLFDTNGDGELDFKEFSVAIWNFCVAEKSELINFTFDLYDEGRTNYLHPRVLREILLDATGGLDKMSKHQEEIYDSVKTIKDPISREKFHQFCNIHKSNFYLLFGLGNDMRRTVVNNPWWDTIRGKRWNSHPVNSLSVTKAFDIHGEGLSYRKRKVKPYRDPRARKKKPTRNTKKTTITVNGRTKILSNLSQRDLKKMEKDLRTKMANGRRR